VTRKYKYYYLDKIYGPYAEKSNEEYPNIDEDDFVYTDYIESTSKPKEKPNREIHNITYYKYKRVKNIKYIKLKNLSNQINISNIYLTYNGEDIDYSVTSTNGNPNTIEKKGYITITFKEEIDQNLIKLKIESNAAGSRIIITTSDDNCDQSTYDSIMNSTFEWIGTNATYYAYSSWVEDLYPFKLNSGRVVIYEGIITKFKYRDKLYRTYREDKVYSNDYLDSAKEPFTIRDDSAYIEEKIIQNERLPLKEETKEENLTNTKTTVKDDLNEIIDVPNTSIGFASKLLEKETLYHLHFRDK